MLLTGTSRRGSGLEIVFEMCYKLGLIWDGFTCMLFIMYGDFMSLHTAIFQPFVTMTAAVEMIYCHHTLA